MSLPDSVIKILRESTTPAFHLIAPMQPGYGWSSPPPLDRRFTMEDCAELLNELMIGLGYGGGYAVQVSPVERPVVSRKNKSSSSVTS